VEHLHPSSDLSEVKPVKIEDCSGRRTPRRFSARKADRQETVKTSRKNIQQTVSPLNGTSLTFGKLAWSRGSQPATPEPCRCPFRNSELRTTGNTPRGCPRRWRVCNLRTVVEIGSTSGDPETRWCRTSGQVIHRFVLLNSQNACHEINNRRLADCLGLPAKSYSEYGRVAELADARDLKSRDLNGSCGFESRLGY
jgi:hypothetical protein